MRYLSASGDWHIGCYDRKIDEGTGRNARLLDTVRAVEFVLQDSGDSYGITEHLFAGDLARTCRPSPTEYAMVQKALMDFGGVIHSIPGNHDIPKSAAEASALEPLQGYLDVYNHPRLLDFEHYQLAVLPYPSKARLAASVEGYAGLSPEEGDKLVGKLLENVLLGLASQVDERRPSILLAHISLDLADPGDSSIMAERDITVPLHAIPEQFTFVCLGHIHKAQCFGAQGRPNVFYTGSTERISFNEENQDKRYVVLDLEGGEVISREIPARRFRTFHFDFDPQAGEGEDFPDNEDPQNPAKDAVVRVKINRPENYKPDYASIQSYLESCGCFDFHGFVEEVDRVAATRAAEMVEAESIEDQIRVYHAAKGSDVPIEQLIPAAQDIEEGVKQ